MPLLAGILLLALATNDDAGLATSWAPPPTTEPPAQIDAVDTVVLRVDGLDAAALRAALTRRRPDLTVRDDTPADASHTAFVEVVATHPDVALDVVLADGRAYRRTLRPGTAPGERAAARLLVQLLAAIAERRAEPERQGVPIPAWTRDAPTDPRTTDAPTAVPEPGADPSPAHVPEPPPPHTGEPPPPADPPPAQPSMQPAAAVHTPSLRPAEPLHGPPGPRPHDPPRPHRPPTARPRTIELALGGDFTALVGLTPPRDVSTLRGLGGALHLDLRLPRGLLVGVAARGLTRGADGFILARLRGAALVGYAHRRRRFELLAAAGLSFETWRVRQAGDGVYYAGPTADTRPLLIGALVRAAPGVRLAASPRVAVRLGAWLELATSFLPSGAAARLSATHHDGQPPSPLFALGGVELAMGLELSAWFTLRR